MSLKTPSSCLQLNIVLGGEAVAQGLRAMALGGSAGVVGEDAVPLGVVRHAVMARAYLALKAGRVEDAGRMLAAAATP